jgi:hypothetical protein
MKPHSNKVNIQVAFIGGITNRLTLNLMPFWKCKSKSKKILKDNSLAQYVFVPALPFAEKTSIFEGRTSWT